MEVAPSFPEECRHVLETLRDAYHNDEITHTQEMTAAERLAFQQANSRPLMDGLERWLREQIDEHKTEPNSGLGEAIAYMQGHWNALTLFLRVAGAPLDSTVCERTLKKAILNRKNALFFKTQCGAQVSDLFMSLIHTTELAGGNPFDYLTELQKHATKLVENPRQWMPWNYQATLAGLPASPT